jgi:hypothetical protein
MDHQTDDSSLAFSETMEKMARTYLFEVSAWQQDDGFWIVWASRLPECQSLGISKEIALEGLEIKLKYYLNTLNEMDNINFLDGLVERRDRYMIAISF